MPLAKETKMLEVVVCEFLNFSLCLILKISTVAVSVCVCVSVNWRDENKISHDFKFNNQIIKFYIYEGTFALKINLLAFAYF